MGKYMNKISRSKIIRSSVCGFIPDAAIEQWSDHGNNPNTRKDKISKSCLSFQCETDA